jgi:DNA repair exonuclease SbcCD ATPase subunit
MRWAIGIVVVVLLAAARPVGAGEEAREEQPAAELEQEGQIEELETPALVEAIKTELKALDELQAKMAETLEAIERVDAEVAALRERRLEERLDQIADLGPEMEKAIEKLRLLRTRADELRTELRQTREAERKAFDALEIEPDDKEMLRALMSDRELPVVPRDRPAVRVRRQDVRGRAQDETPRERSELARAVRERDERRREERQRRLDELAQSDPELHELMAKKAELTEQLDEPRAELAGHMDAIRRVLREVQRRLGALNRLVEPGPEL